MNRAGKVIALSIALTGGLWVYSYASPGNTDTYVSKSGLMSAQPEKSSGLVFTQLLQDSSKVETADSTQLREANTIKAKEPYKAFLYALVPGAVLHGAGHFYAGKTGTGFLLVGSELVGATLMIAGSGRGWGRGYLTTEDVAMELVGGALFFGSWLYDIVRSPLIVDKENQQLKESQADLRFRMHSTSLKLVITWQF